MKIKINYKYDKSLNNPFVAYTVGVEGWMEVFGLSGFSFEEAKHSLIEKLKTIDPRIEIPEPEEVEI